MGISAHVNYTCISRMNMNYHNIFETVKKASKNDLSTSQLPSIQTSYEFYELQKHLKGLPYPFFNLPKQKPPTQKLNGMFQYK